MQTRFAVQLEILEMSVGMQPCEDQAKISRYKPALINFNQWSIDKLSQQAKKKHTTC